MINHGKYLGTTNMDERGQIAIPCVGLEIKQDETFAVFGNPRKGTVILIKSEFEKKFPHLVN
ncbi:AbrB family transcriptional regulator, partial [Alkalihalophilus pseudofirmus]|nr:AbrB family transcriptional regulator [Alkalihalophilus pseudofirmus]